MYGCDSRVRYPRGISMTDGTMQEAAIAMGGGDFTAAMNLFDEARQADENNADAHYG